MTHHLPHVAVVGGGISGLATAFFLRREAEAAGRPLDVVVLEASHRPGGKMWTDRADGFLVEEGPNGFLDNKPHALDLAGLAGAAGSLLPASDAARKRFICKGGRLVRLPESPPAFLASTLLSWRGKLKVLFEPFAPRAPEGVDETVAAFAARRLGPEAARMLIDPMVSGIFAGDPARLSLAAAFPRIVELERQYGGLIKGMIGVMREAKRARARVKDRLAAPAGPGGRLTSFSGGVSTLVEALTNALGPAVELGAEVLGVRRCESGWTVTVGRGQERREVHADAVVLACPAHEADRLVADESADLAGLLGSIPYASITVVATGFDLADCPRPLDGFGFLVPASEGKPILGTLWDSCVFPDRAPPGKVLFRSMVGGARAPELAALPEDELVRLVLAQLSELMGVKTAPCMVRVYRHEMGIPQYEVGHLARMAEIDSSLARIPGLFLCNNAYRGIALNDCAREAMLTASNINEYLMS